MQSIRTAAVLIWMYGLAALLTDTAIYYPLSEPVLSAVSGRLLAVAASFILGVGVWRMRLRAYGITTAFTFWFALTATDRAGYLLVRTAFDGDPFPLGDFVLHLLVVSFLGVALVLLLRQRALFRDQLAQRQSIADHEAGQHEDGV